MRILITRSRLSLQYQHDPKLNPTTWYNNSANNSLDLFALFGEEGVAGQVAPLFTSRVQSVANLEGLDPGVHFLDTIAPGPFELELFVEQRAFWPQIHGIINARTLGGEWIGDDSITPTNKDRTLMHDWQFPRGFILNGQEVPQGKDTSYAQSAACLVLPDAKLLEFDALMDKLELGTGFIINGEVRMAD